MMHGLWIAQVPTALDALFAQISLIQDLGEPPASTGLSGQELAIGVGVVTGQKVLDFGVFNICIPGDRRHRTPHSSFRHGEPIYSLSMALDLPILPLCLRSPWIGRFAGTCSAFATLIAVTWSSAPLFWKILWGAIAVGGVIVTMLAAEANRQGNVPYSIDIEPTDWLEDEPAPCGDHFHDQYRYTVSSDDHQKIEPQLTIMKHTEHGLMLDELDVAAEIAPSGDVTFRVSPWGLDDDDHDSPGSSKLTDCWRIQIR